MGEKWQEMLVQVLIDSVFTDEKHRFYTDEKCRCYVETTGTHWSILQKMCLFFRKHSDSDDSVTNV